MVGEIEQRVRDMDDESVPYNRRAREIEQETGGEIKFGTAFQCLGVKRRGFGSVYEYKNSYYEGGWDGYLNRRYAERGLLGPSEYQRYLSSRKKLIEEDSSERGFVVRYETSEEWRERKWDEKFYRNGLEVREIGEDEFVDSGESVQDMIAIVDRLVETLNDKDKEFVRLRYYEGKIFEKIGTHFGYGRKNCDWVNKRILKTLKDNYQALFG